MGDVSDISKLIKKFDHNVKIARSKWRGQKMQNFNKLIKKKLKNCTCITICDSLRYKSSFVASLTIIEKKQEKSSRKCKKTYTTTRSTKLFTQ